ncbi:hypothetical protein BJY04DRAFT_220302 [Aspergillus karnatakaensis]|uniref:uncharacterized protein n=1 Tax=Aspergillus karnatakaensis TaxID=1810916 RepID=UPI003CCD1DB2
MSSYPQILGFASSPAGIEYNALGGRLISMIHLGIVVVVRPNAGQEGFFRPCTEQDLNATDGRVNTPAIGEHARGWWLDESTGIVRIGFGEVLAVFAQLDVCDEGGV